MGRSPEEQKGDFPSLCLSTQMKYLPFPRHVSGEVRAARAVAGFSRLTSGLGFSLKDWGEVGGEPEGNRLAPGQGHWSSGY